MTPVLAHTTVGGSLLPLDVAGVVLAVGLVVLVAVAYDYYRNRWSGGE